MRLQISPYQYRKPERLSRLQKRGFVQGVLAWYSDAIEQPSGTSKHDTHYDGNGASVQAH